MPHKLPHGARVPRTRPVRQHPKHLLGEKPPTRDEDPELHLVADWLHTADPGGHVFAEVLRDTIDQLLDGQKTGRWDWLTLRKTEKTHMGTLVEINLHREFEFEDGDATDYRIAGIEVDCKFSQNLGGWELPPEALGHICLLVWAHDDSSRWEAGLIRVTEDLLRASVNRDAKRRLRDEGESRILWLYPTPALPENLLLQLDDATRERIFAASGPRNGGQGRINELLCSVQGRIVRRSVILTVGMQDDSMKRAREARLPQHLGQKGILVLGHRAADLRIARAFSLPAPALGQFVSVRVHPDAGPPRPGTVRIAGALWRIARPDDPVVPAPQLERGRSPEP